MDKIINRDGESDAQDEDNKQKPIDILLCNYCEKKGRIQFILSKENNRDQKCGNCNTYLVMDGLILKK